MDIVFQTKVSSLVSCIFVAVLISTFFIAYIVCNLNDLLLKDEYFGSLIYNLNRDSLCLIVAWLSCGITKQNLVKMKFGVIFKLDRILSNY